MAPQRSSLAFITPVLPSTFRRQRRADAHRAFHSARRTRTITRIVTRTIKACDAASGTPEPHPLHAEGIPRFASEPSSVPISESQISEWLTQVTDASPTVRLRAILACRHLTPSAAAPILYAAYDAGEKELQNRGFLALFLGYKPTSRSYEILSEMVTGNEKEEVRANAIAGLGYLRDARAVPICVGCLRQGHWSARTAAAVSLGMIAEAHADVRGIISDDLSKALREANGDWGVVTACLGALGDVGDVRAVELVKEYMDAEDFVVAQCAVEALGKMPSEESLVALRKVVDSDAHVNVLWAAELGVKKVEGRLKERQ